MCSDVITHNDECYSFIQMDEMRDISDALMGPSALTSSEEEDLEAELEAIMSTPVPAPLIIALPKAPTTLPAQPQQTEIPEDEIKELEERLASL